MKWHAAVLVTTILTSGALLAQDAPPPADDGPLGVEFMEACDTDGDLKVSKTEWKRSADLFGVLDTDRDGFVTVDEFYAYQDEQPKTAPRPQPGPPPGGMPARPGIQPGTGQRPQLGQAIARWDTDGNGAVTLEEWQGPPQMFKRLDMDGDGVVTKEEFRQSRQQRRANRRGGMGGGGMGAAPGQGWQPGQQLRQWDTNGDGVLEVTEWQGRPQVFKRLDGDGDGRLTGEELKGAAQFLRRMRQNIGGRGGRRFGGGGFGGAYGGQPGGPVGPPPVDDGGDDDE